MTYDEICEAIDNGVIPVEFPKWQWNMTDYEHPVSLAPEIYQNRKGILTRYGRKLLAEREEREINEKKKYRSIDDPWEAS
jgi:hypothetical protein